MVCAIRARHPARFCRFGHLHFASSAATAALASAAAEPLPAAADDPPAPTKHSRVADYCTICASIHLAGLLTAEPPSVSTLHPSSGERLKVLIEAHDKQLIPGFRSTPARLPSPDISGSQVVRHRPRHDAREPRPHLSGVVLIRNLARRDVMKALRMRG